MRPIFKPFIAFLIIFSSCTKNRESFLDLTIPAPTADAFSLEEGSAKVNITGSKTFSMNNVVCDQWNEWRDGEFQVKSIRFLDTVQDFAFTLNLLFRPETGNTAPMGVYELRKLQPVEKEPGIDKLANMYIYYNSSSVISLGANDYTRGKITVLSNANDITIGNFEIVGMGVLFGEYKHYYNLRGSFKAPIN